MLAHLLLMINLYLIQMYRIVNSSCLFHFPRIVKSSHIILFSSAKERMSEEEKQMMSEEEEEIVEQSSIGKCIHFMIR